MAKRWKFPMQKQLMHVMMGGDERFTIPDHEGIHFIIQRFNNPIRPDGQIMTTAGLLPLTTVVTVISRGLQPVLKPKSSTDNRLLKAIEELTIATTALTRKMGDLRNNHNGSSAPTKKLSEHYHQASDFDVDGMGGW